jgi:NADPH:quinone reductase-like Zn-dependent oxidoreductase
MKAIIQDKNGSRDVLKLREIAKPVAKDDEALVRVHAASVHPDVWHVMRGRPYALRIMEAGLLKPRTGFRARIWQDTSSRWAERDAVSTRR